MCIRDSILPVRLTPAGDTVLQTALRMDDLYTGMQDELAELRRVAPARIRICLLYTSRCV